MKCKLGDADVQIIDGDRGKNYPNEFTDNGYCLFLSTKNVTSTGFSFDDKQFITKERDELLRKGKLMRNDVVLTTRGTVGNVALYDNSIPFSHIRINSGMVILRSNPQSVHPVYLYYVMKSEIIKRQIIQMQTGSAQPQFPISHMVNLEIPMPSLAEQLAIVAVLSCLDNKITNNKKINHHLAPTISETDSSPVIRRGKRELRKLLRLRISNKLSRKCLTIGRRIYENSCTTSLDGITIGISARPLSQIA
jgi:type I restriction enzyme S subunit